MADLSFNVAALDNASKTFIKVSQQLEKLAERMDALDRKKAELTVTADTRAAERQLDRLVRQQGKVKIDADPSALERTLRSAMTGLGAAAGGAMTLGSALGRLTLPATLVSSIGALAPALAAAAAAAASAAGALLLLPAAAAAGATAFGALSVGVLGIGDAISAIGDAGAAAGGGGAAAASAAKAVETARRNLARTIVQGDERVADAERALARAQEDAQDAQDDLNRARQEAVERLSDMQLELRSGALSEKEAVLAVAEAEARLREAMRDGDGLDVQNAQLGLERAQLSLEETRERYQDLQQEAAAAAKAGVEGDRDVVAAKRGVEDATSAVEDAQRSLARTVRDAAEAQEDALRAVADAQQSLASGGGGGVDRFAQALAKLSPAAQAFVLALKDAKGAFDDMQLDVQERLFSGLGDRVGELSAIYLPILGEAFGKVADSANTALHEVAGLLEERKADFEFMGDAGAQAFDNLAAAVKPLGEALADIATVGSEFLGPLTDGAGSAAQQFADFIAEARESGQLKEWIQGGLDALKALGGVLADVGGIVSGLFNAASTGATDSLGPLGELLDATNAWVNSVEGQETLSTFFQAGADIVKALAPALGELASIIGTTVAPALADLAKEAGPGLTKFIEALGKGLEALATPGEDGASAMQKIGEALGDVMTALAPVMPVLGEALAEALIILAPHLDDIAIAFADMVRELAPYLPMLSQLAVDLLPLLIIGMDTFTDAMDKLEGPIGKVLDLVGWLAEKLAPFYDDLQRLTNPISQVAGALEELQVVGKQVWEDLSAAFGRAKDRIGEIVNQVVGFFSGLGGRISSATSGAWNGLTDAFKSAINGIIRRWNGLSFTFPSVDIPGIGKVGGATLHTPDIPYLDVGGRVLQDGLAFIHKNEQVIPAAQVEPLRPRNGSSVTTLRAGDDVSRWILETLRRAVGSRGGNVQFVIGS